MAAVVDRRFDNTSYPLGTMNSAPMQPGVIGAGADQVIVTDTYGGWMTRGMRAVVFGLVGFALVLGTFLPGLIFTGRNWNNGMRDGTNGCTDDVVRRALITSAFFIFHACLVIPMFIIGDRAHSVTVNNGYQGGLRSFWTTRLAHTAAVLQAVGNLIEWALLIWTAVAFWHNVGLSGNGGACKNNYSSFHDWLWAGLIIGFAISTLSLITVHWQYTSAAIRYRLGNGKGGFNNVSNNGGVLASAP